MIPQRICVTVEASTKVRFIASILTTHTIKDTLPQLLSKYQEVIKENMKAQQYNIELFEANSIKQITKNGCLIPLKEYVSDVIVNGDQLFINLEIRKEKVLPVNHDEPEKIQSKKERLEKKKEEKKIVEQKKQKGEIREPFIKEEKNQNSERQQPNLQKTIQPHLNPKKQIKEIQIKKNAQNVNKQDKTIIQKVKITEKESKDLTNKLLVKMRLASETTPSSKPVQKNKKVIIQQQSSSSD